ncbi:TIR domain-containing protein, partial [candidate division KSB3 bacterium]|nr:TIR domain-containing protein [candidate division KSB3 bacterium]MBD3323880.1 TIR domain-containing protein [candidate division KSB3 bacterium]
MRSVLEQVVRPMMEIKIGKHIEKFHCTPPGYVTSIQNSERVRQHHPAIFCLSKFALLSTVFSHHEIWQAECVRKVSIGIAAGGKAVEFQYDIFISHASEDKAEIARPLAEALRQAGLRVWYDEFILKPGQSLSRAIRRGQRQSKYALLVLSPNYFANERWAERELDGFIAREIHAGQVLIPLWHRVTYQEVVAVFPDIADKFAIQSDRGLKHVVQAVVDLFKEEQELQSPGEQEVSVVEESPPIQEEPETTTEADVVEATEFVADLQARSEASQARLDKQPPSQPPIRLRSEAQVVSTEEAQKVFQLDERDRPLKYIQNDFEDQGDVVLDHATGLMWQKSGSTTYMSYGKAQKYVKELNHKQFAGYSDWRLPT